MTRDLFSEDVLEAARTLDGLGYRTEADILRSVLADRDAWRALAKDIAHDAEARAKEAQTAKGESHEGR